MSVLYSYTELYKIHYGLLMMITMGIFKNKSYYPDEPSIFQSYPRETSLPANSKSPIEVQQEPGAPLWIINPSHCI